ncbi:MAG: hypothetical protein K0R38_6313 [Polyangiaceae bacterium]|jgi:phosphoribosylaminoimidazole-succinocarboxamide synthase|nr:hypothetical protein [Polyangiaceae bacterium]
MRVFSANPRRREFAPSDAELASLCAESAACFVDLPPYHLGESVHIRRTSVPGLLIQRMVPSLNSITFERKGTVVRTDRLRLEISELFWTALHRNGLATCHLARDGEHLLISEERAVPVEVIVKAALVGTPARIYRGLALRTDRFGHRFAEHGRHEPYVRFDYRNPLRGPKGELLRDECMPEALADRLIDTAQAARNALRIFEVVRSCLARIGLDVWDACFLFDETGRVLCNEISPDNIRVKNADWATDPRPTNEFDKDLWRRGSDDASIESQWRMLYERLEQDQGSQHG